MSDNIYERPNLIVTRFVGPESQGEDRQCWQITPTDGYAVLERDEVLELAHVLIMDASEGQARR